MKYSQEIAEEIAYSKQLFNLKYLPGPKECKCHSTVFNIYYDSQYKVNPMSFTCTNSKCRKNFPITINYFFREFSHQKLKLISEILKIFLTFDFNTQKAFKYLNYELNISCSKELIYKVYKAIRIVISKFLAIDYESNRLGYLNENKYFAVDECNILNIEIHIYGFMVS